MEEEPPPPPPNSNNVEMHDEDTQRIIINDGKSPETIQPGDDGNQEFSNISKITNKVSTISFREAVSKSTQWFDEAKKIITTSKEWNDEEENIAADSNLVVTFDRDTLARLRSPRRLTRMVTCLGVNVKLAYMDTRVRSMWRIKGSMETINVEK